MISVAVATSGQRGAEFSDPGSSASSAVEWRRRDRLPRSPLHTWMPPPGQAGHLPMRRQCAGHHRPAMRASSRIRPNASSRCRHHDPGPGQALRHRVGLATSQRHAISKLRPFEQRGQPSAVTAGTYYHQPDQPGAPASRQLSGRLVCRAQTADIDHAFPAAWPGCRLCQYLRGQSIRDDHRLRRHSRIIPDHQRAFRIADLSPGWRGQKPPFQEGIDAARLRAKPV